MNPNQTFINLNRGLTDAYVLWDGKNYTTIHANLTDNHYTKHLEGQHSLGIIPITRDGKCSFGIIDDDSHKADKSKPVQEYNYKNLLKKLKLLGIVATVFKSKNGGAHIKLNFDKPYPAKKVRRYLKKIAYQICESSYDVIPKQDELGKEKTGTCINLAYHNGNTRVVIDDEGNELNLQKGMEYESNRVLKLEQLDPYYLLSTNEAPAGRNNKLFSAAVYLKKNFPKNWKDRVKELNKTYTDPLTVTELDNTVLTSVEKKDYCNDSELGEMPKLKCFTLKAYMNLGITPSLFIVQRLIRANSINYVSGPKGNGKTEFVLGLTHSLTRGLPFLNYTCPEPTPILYVDGEMDPYDLIERSEAYISKMNYPKDDNYFRIINYAQQFNETIPDIKGEIGQNLIAEWLDEQRKQTNKNPVLVLDNLRSLSNYKENDSDEYRLINSWLLRLRGQKYTIIVVDHHGKSASGPRGTSSKTDNANVSLLLNSIKEKGNSCMVMKVSYDKARGLRPDETEEYEAVYDFAGNWLKKDARVKANHDALCQRIKECYEKRVIQEERYQKSLDKDLAKGKLTIEAYKTICKNHKKTWTQKELAQHLKIAVGKLNSILKDGIYDNWLKENSKQ